MSSSSKCYYPNGDEVTAEPVQPCGSGDGVACCPKGWECQSNGLCHLGAENFYGRYSCTDKSWESDGCPHICTYGLTASGNEAVLECNSNEWCCDTNRPELSGGQACCETNPPLFGLDSSKTEKNGTSSSSSSKPQSNSGSSSNSHSGSSSNDNNKSSGDSSNNNDNNKNSPDKNDSSSQNSSPSTSSTPKSTTKPATTSKSQQQNRNSATSVVIVTSVVSSQSGSPGSTVVISSIQGAAATAGPDSTSTSTSTSSKSLGPIIGPAVAVPLVLILAGIALFFFLRRRRRQKAARSAESYAGGGSAEPMYKEQFSPYSPGKSELEGSSPNLAQSPGGLARYESPSDVGAGGAGVRNSGRSPKSVSQKASSRLSEVENTEQQPAMAELPSGEMRRGGGGPGVGSGLGIQDKRASELPAVDEGRTEQQVKKEGPWLSAG